jgi:hypothetical protein
MNDEHRLLSKDTFEEVDDPHGHIKKMFTSAVLNQFWKNGVPNHKLILKIGDISLVTCVINGLGLAKNSQVQDNNVCRHSAEVSPIGHNEQQTIRIPCISFKFRMPFGQ